MKLSCLPVSYFNEIIKGKKTIQEWAIEAKEIGYNYIDLSILFFQKLDKDYFLRLRDELDRIGIGIAILNTYPDFTHPGSSKRKNELLKIKDYIQVAEVLGAKYIRLTTGQAHPETSTSDGIAWATEGLKEALEFAAGASVELLYENHAKPGIWDYTDFSFDVSIFLKIYERINDPRLKILFDTANPVASGVDPVELLDKVCSGIACIHAADTKAKGVFKPTIIGTGAVPFKDIFTKLKKLGFNGIISIEEASFTGKGGIVTAHNYIREAWQNTSQQ